MNRSECKLIAETISNQDLLEMFRIAKSNITDWNETSIVNKGMTKGAAWNILAKNFDVNKKYHILAKINMVQEFQKYLPDRLKIKREPKKKGIPVHQEPRFDIIDFNQWEVIEKCKNDKDISAIAWNHTSVNSNPWTCVYYDEKKDEPVCYNIFKDSKHWELFDELDDLDMEK